MGWEKYIYYQDNFVTILLGDNREILPQLEAESVQTVVTSPPYFGLRDYGVEGQIGLEGSVSEYVAELRDLFAFDAWRVMRKDATFWLNLGDSFAGGKGQSGSQGAEHQETRNKNQRSLNKGYQTLGGQKQTKPTDDRAMLRNENLKPKDLIGIPWRVAFALQESGYYLRSDIIWHKPNPMPESVTDRPTKSHEYIFLLAKSDRYFYDAEAIKEPALENNWESRLQRESLKSFPTDKQNSIRTKSTFGNRNGELDGLHSGNAYNYTGKRNKRSVWTVATKPYSEAHFATFPVDLIKPCILAGTSNFGACPCSSPYERVLEKESFSGERGSRPSDFRAIGQPQRGNVGCATKTLSWQPTC